MHIQPSRNYLNLHDFELTILQAEEIFDRLEEIALSTSLDLQPVRQLIHKYTLGLYRTMGEARRYFRNPDDEQQLQYIEAMLINWINETTEFRP